MKHSEPKHKTYIINLEKRIDRRVGIEREFVNRTEFDITVFRAIEQQSGALGLFQSYQKIIEIAVEQELEYVIICEDDHIFTREYNKADLNEQISIGRELGFDVLLGGMSNVHDALFFNSNLVWVGGFSGLQFAVVFKKFYTTILTYTLREHPLDLALGQLSDQIYCCYPAISSQYSYGYSDVTLKNNTMKVETYFQTCNKKLDRISKVSQYFDMINN